MEDTNDIIKKILTVQTRKNLIRIKDKARDKDKEKVGRPKQEIFSTNSRLDVGTPGYKPNFTIQLD